MKNLHKGNSMHKVSKKQLLFHCLLSLSTLIGYASSEPYTAPPTSQEIKHFTAIIADLEPGFDERNLKIKRHDEPTQIKAYSGDNGEGLQFEFYIGIDIQSMPIVEQKTLLQEAMSNIITPQENDHFHAMIKKIYPYITIAGIYKNGQADADEKIQCIIFTKHGSKYPIFSIGKKVKNLPLEEQEYMIKKLWSCPEDC